MFRLITPKGRKSNQARLKIQKIEPFEELNKETSQILHIRYVHKKGGMETLGGNEVNPGYRTKKLMLKFPRASLTNEINKKI